MERNGIVKTNILSNMNKKEQDKIVKEVKGVLPTVLQFMNKHPFIADFDYGFLYGAGIWEATFFDENDEAILYFTAASDSELVDEINGYTFGHLI